MKVVRIIAWLNVGGPARHVAWLEAGLLAAGVESLLVAGVVPPGEDDMGYFAESLGVRPHVIPEMSREISPKDLVTVWKLYRLFLRERPGVVHTHTAKAGTAGGAGSAGRFRVGRRELFEVIPLGLDTRAFDGWPARRHVLRREWGAGERDILVGIVGRLTEVKNHRLFLEAAALFKMRREFADRSGGARRDG